MTAPAVVALGECMLELARRGPDWRMGFAGDTFNTALYLQRLGVPTAYFTALGTDAFSDEMRAAWADEGLDLSLVLTHPTRLPGLYAIRTDAAGERSFFYWREQSAARDLFLLPGIDRALAAAAAAPLLYLSGISLSLFTAAQCERIVQLARAVRARGGTVVFDLNYRPSGWPSVAAARSRIGALTPLVSWALPSFDEAGMLYDHATPEDAATYWQDAGAAEVVVKLGARGCLVAGQGRHDYLPARAVASVLDTTGAGDAFNAAYIAARIAGRAALAAAAAAQLLAAEVVGQPGAIIAREHMARILPLLHAPEVANRVDHR